MNMRSHALLMPLCVLLGCASISGSQSFQAVNEYTLPAVGIGASVGTGTATVSAVAMASTRSFAQSVLIRIEQLRSNDHVDSADVSIRIVEMQLSSNTTFAGVKALRAQLVTETETIELCNRTLSASEEASSSITCDVDHEIGEAALQRSSESVAPAQIGIQLEVSADVTATKLSTAVTFQVDVDVNASL